MTKNWKCATSLRESLQCVILLSNNSRADTVLQTQRHHLHKCPTLPPSTVHVPLSFNQIIKRKPRGKKQVLRGCH